MRISAIGMCSNVAAGFKPARLPCLVRLAKAGLKPAITARYRGFTLIELLVVVVIIGIVLATVSLSLGVLGRDNEVEDQSKRLYGVLTQVREEAELQGRDVGLLIERDGYLFMRYDYGVQQWQVLSNDELLLYHQLPAGLQFRLWLDGREVILKNHQENRASFASSASAASSSSIASPTSASGLRPQIAILSSGDILPFELQLARDNNDFHWRLLAAADNTLNIESASTTR
jgi:general secretion pathway protein H